ncbi:MAG: 5-formyltetrahydrofolate cyclo-ligase, partial [Clostridia bacterium]|nr:5-formyltetrahydrofolate cyclo-ligase [Clostridia bacterium]
EASMLSGEYIDAANAAIFERLIALPEYIAAGSLFSYVSCEREPDTRRIIRYALARGKRVYVPRITGSGLMEATRIDARDLLEPDRYGILTPAAGETASPSELEFSLIPCLSATPDGYRLGHGGGYYDRFFAPAARGESAPAFGAVMNGAVLCFERLLSAELPASPDDVQFGIVVTETRILRLT